MAKKVIAKSAPKKQVATPMKKELHEAGAKLGNPKTSKSEAREKAIMLNLKGQVKKLHNKIDKLEKKNTK